VAAALAQATQVPGRPLGGVADPELGRAPYLYAQALAAVLASPSADGADALHVPGSPAHARMSALLAELLDARRALVMVATTVSAADVHLTYDPAEAAEMTFRLSWLRTETYDAADGTLLEAVPGPRGAVRVHATLQRSADGTWRVATMSSGVF
jgi:hypothetical protein